MTRRADARLADLGVQAEVADQLARLVEAADVADGGDERRRGHQAHPGHGHQSLDRLGAERVLGDRALEDRDLAVEEVDLAQAPVDGLALVAGQLERGQPRAAPSPERVAHRWAALERAHQHGMDLVLATRALPDELRAARQAPAQRPRLLVRQPAAVQQPGGEQPRQRARVAAVGLDLRLGDRPQLRPSGDDDSRHVRLQRPRDRQRVAGRLQRHVILGAEAVGQDRQPLRAGRHAAPGPHAPRLADRDLAEIEVDV